VRSYGKALLAVVGAIVVALYNFLNDNTVSVTEMIAIIIAGVTAISVYMVPLTPEWPWMKTAIGVVLVVLNALVIIIVDGVTQQEIWELVIVALTAAGISMAPAVSHNGVGSNP